MAAGFATAEIKVTATYKTSGDLAQHEVTDAQGNSHGTTFFSNDGSQYPGTKGALDFKASTNYGGYELEILQQNNGSTVGKPSLVLDKYSGWLTWGNLTLKSGKWDTRAVGRVNKSLGNLESAYFGEINKPGLASGLGTAGNGKDISQQSGYKGSAKQQTMMLQYVNKDWGLEARGAYIDNDGIDSTFAGGSTKSSTDSKTNVTTTTYSDGDETKDARFANEAWFGELGYTVKGVGRILGTTKLMHNDYAFAAFFEPKLDNVKALTSLIGFTVETARHGMKDSDGDYQALNAYALDLRARYDLADAGVPLAITLMYNWTFGEKAKNSGSDDRVYGAFASWAMLDFRYTLNETFSPFLSVIYTSGVNSHATSGDKTVLAYYKPAAKDQKFSDPYNFSLRVYGGVEIYSSATTSLSTGIVWDAANMMERKVTYSAADGHNEAGIHKAGLKAISVPILLKIGF